MSTATARGVAQAPPVQIAPAAVNHLPSAIGSRIPAALTTVPGQLTKVPLNAQGLPKVLQGPDPFATNLDPLGHPGWNIGRTDMGVDANAPVGTPIIAPNTSKVVGLDPNWYKGQPQLVLQFTKGPNKGQYWYAAEQIDHLPPIGAVIPRGAPVARYAPAGTGIEIGLAADPHGTTLAQATTGYSEGQVTPAGQQMAYMIRHGGQPSGNPGGNAIAAPQGSVTSVAPNQVTPELFAANLLKQLGAPVNKTNMRAIVGWERAEGGHWNNTAKYNPLNTTMPEPGYSQTGSQGNIGSYTSWQQGLQATVDTLKLQAHNYPQIIAALKAGNSIPAIESAINSSGWLAGGYGSALDQAIRSVSPGTAGTSGSLPGGSVGASPASSGGSAGSGGVDTGSGSTGGTSFPASSQQTQAQRRQQIANTFLKASATKAGNPYESVKLPRSLTSVPTAVHYKLAAAALASLAGTHIRAVKV